MLVTTDGSGGPASFGGTPIVHDFLTFGKYLAIRVRPKAYNHMVCRLELYPVTAKL